MSDRLTRLEAEVAALDRFIQEQFAARDRALDVIAENTTYVRSQQNEWRGTVADLAASKVDRETFNIAMDALSERVTMNTNMITLREGSTAGARYSYGLIVGAIGIFIGLASIAIAAAAVILSQ